jgi:hypothetical protein
MKPGCSPHAPAMALTLTAIFALTAMAQTAPPAPSSKPARPAGETKGSTQPGAPERAAGPDTPAAAKPKAAGEAGDATPKLPGIDLELAQRRFTIEGFTCVKRASQLEVLACTKRGKTHESLLLLNCTAKHLQLALLLLGLEPSPQIQNFGDAGELRGARVVIEAEWREGTRPVRCRDCFDGRCERHSDPASCARCAKLDPRQDGGWCENCQIGWRWDRPVRCEPCWKKTCDGHFERECEPCAEFKAGRRKTHCPGAVAHGDVECRRCYENDLEGRGWCELCKHGVTGGRTVRRRVEDLILNRKTDRSMKRAGWVFTGSRELTVPNHDDPKKIRTVFAAEFRGNLAVTFHDPDAILDIPLAEGGDDTSYLPYEARLPRRLTPVRVHVRPWRDGDDAPPEEKPADESRD